MYLELVHKVYLCRLWGHADRGTGEEWAHNIPCHVVSQATVTAMASTVTPVILEASEPPAVSEPEPQNTASASEHATPAAPEPLASQQRNMTATQSNKRKAPVRT